MEPWPAKKRKVLKDRRGQSVWSCLPKNKSHSFRPHLHTISTMGMLARFRKTGGNEPSEIPNRESVSTAHTPPDMEKGEDQTPVKLFSLRVFSMIMIVSMGGMIFGYDTGQISGFLEMPDFLARFGNTTTDGKPAFTNVRQGLIVGLVCLTCLVAF